MVANRTTQDDRGDHTVREWTKIIHPIAPIDASLHSSDGLSGFQTPSILQATLSVLAEHEIHPERANLAKRTQGHVSMHSNSL